MKSNVKRSNTTYKLSDVERLTNDALDAVTPEEWRKAVGHVIDVEDSYRKSDHIMDDLVER